MKNFSSFEGVFPFIKWKKLLLIMKLTIALSFLFSISVVASSYSQNFELTLNLKNAALGDVLKEIREKSEFSFWFKDNELDLNELVSIKVEKENIESVLNKLLKEQNVSYKIFDKHIVIYKPSKESSKLPAGSFQGITVTGRIVDAITGEALPGVNISVEGTTIGVVSDLNGNYSISAPSSESVLLFSFVGYMSERIALTGQTTLDLALSPDITKLDEVVVIGYGSRSRKDVTTSISSISSDNISKVVSMSPELAMQGQMTGVSVSRSDGNPMSRPQIRIRGVNTWGVSSPLYIIDGIPVTEYGAGIEGVEDAGARFNRGPQNIMTLIDPNDIESISVLKDASAAAIYGVRAANGVILVTTKKGRSDKPAVEFSARYGMQNITQELEYLNTQQYSKFVQDVYATDPTFAVDNANKFVFNPADPAYLGNSKTYNWQGAYKTKNAPTKDYSFRLSGGSSSSDYYLSLGYTGTDGVLVENDLKRYSGSIKLNTQINKYLKMGLNYRLSASTGHDNSDKVSLLYAATTPPWQPIYDPEGPAGFAQTVKGFLPDGTYSKDRLYGLGTAINYLGEYALNDNRYNMLRNIGNIYVELSPFKGLKISGKVNLDTYSNTRDQFINYKGYVFSQGSPDPRTVAGGNSFGSYEEQVNKNYNLVNEFTVNYNASFKNHNLDLLFNAMDQRYNSNNITYNSAYLSTPVASLRRFEGSNTYKDVNSSLNRGALQGLLGRIGYNYNSKYYLDLTLRRDGSANFSPDKRWGTFPAASFAWRVSSESFMENLTWLNDLKFRAGWGKLGNQEVRPWAFLSPIYSTSPYQPQYAFGNDPTRIGYGYYNAGIMVTGVPNPNLHWEETKTVNIGLDAVILNGLTLSMEYYNKLTSGILQAVTIPSSVGAAVSPVSNIASVRNKGIEMSMNYTKTLNDLTISFGANLTTVNNQVESVYKDIPFSINAVAGINQLPFGRVEEGHSLYYIYGYQVDGIFQSPEDIAAWRATHPRGDALYTNAKIGPGDMYFKDSRGAPKNPGEFYSIGPDSAVNTYDQVDLGNTIPKYFYGFNLNVSWKGLDLGAQFTGVGEVYKINVIRQNMENTSSVSGNQSPDVLNAWTPENTSSEIPRIFAGDPSRSMRLSDRFVENASYLRLSNLQIGYSLPETLNRISGNLLKDMRIYAGMSNLLTITKYSGLDPESDLYPAPRVTYFGFNVKF